MNDIIEAISCEKEIIQLKLLNVPKHPKEVQLHLYYQCLITETLILKDLKDKFKE